MKGRHLVLIACIGGLLSACSETPPSPIPEKRATVSVQTLTLDRGEWVRNFTAYGSIEPAEEVDISVDVSATVREVKFDEGQRVKAGDVLIVLDEKKLKLQANSARASVEEARAQFDQAKSTFERNKSIFQKGVISKQAYQQSEVDVKARRAALQRSIASYDIALQELKDAEVVSAVDGVVTRRSVEPGSNVNPSSKLGTIRGEDVLRVETYVSEKDINFLRVGQSCTVTSPGAPTREYQGRIESLGVAADEATGNFRVRITVSNDDQALKDGMSARVELASVSQNNVMVLPRSAVVDRNRRQVVFIVQDGEAVEVEPMIGIGNADSVPVLSGLDSGSELIVSNLHLVSQGQKVDVNHSGSQADGQPRNTGEE